MVPIGKKPAPGDNESSLKIFLANFALQDIPVPNYSIVSSQKWKGPPMSTWKCSDIYEFIVFCLLYVTNIISFYRKKAYHFKNYTCFGFYEKLIFFSRRWENWTNVYKYETILHDIQSVKKLLLPPNFEIIIVPSNHSNFQYCDSLIWLFSIAPCKIIPLNPLCILFGIQKRSHEPIYKKRQLLLSQSWKSNN